MINDATAKNGYWTIYISNKQVYIKYELHGMKIVFRFPGVLKEMGEDMSENMATKKLKNLVRYTISS